MIGKEEPTNITSVGDPLAGKPPTSTEPVAKAPQVAQETLCYPSDIMQSERVEDRPEDVVVGDFLRAQGWSRVRRVECIDSTDDGPVLLLREPDESRTNAHGIRRLDMAGWKQRGAWNRYPNLRRLWDAAHDGA
jgi:hypothetical protein